MIINNPLARLLKGRIPLRRTYSGRVLSPPFLSENGDIVFFVHSEKEKSGSIFERGTFLWGCTPKPLDVSWIEDIFNLTPTEEFLLEHSIPDTLIEYLNSDFSGSIAKGFTYDY